MFRGVEEELLTVVPVRSVSAEGPPAISLPQVSERPWTPEALLVGLCAALFLLTAQLGERERILAEWEARPPGPSAAELSARTGVSVRATLRTP